MMCTNERSGDVCVDETASVGWFVLRRVVGVSRCIGFSTGCVSIKTPVREGQGCVGGHER
eukprot:2032541-Pleurochrysis_carterae.AAC.1